MSQLVKMETVTITRRICLHSRFLDHNIKHHLLRELSNATKGECSKDHGHIISVKGINRIVDHKIGRANSDNVFTIEFQALTLNPKVGTEVLGTVCMIYKDGVFINIMDKQKMLIPTTSLTGDDVVLGFDESTGNYNISDRSIKVGDDIDATITASQYSNGFFSCLGALKDV